MAVPIVWNKVACTTSSAVSGASTERDDPPGSCSAIRYANTAVAVSRATYTAVGCARRRTSVSCSAWRLAAAMAASPTLSPGTGRTGKPFMSCNQGLVGGGNSSNQEQNPLLLTNARPGELFPPPGPQRLHDHYFSERAAVLAPAPVPATLGTSRTTTGTTSRPVSAQLSPNPCAITPTASGPRPPASPAALLSVTAAELRPGRLPYSRACSRGYHGAVA